MIDVQQIDGLALMGLRCSAGRIGIGPVKIALAVS